jgi:hypothetical protein
MKKIQKNNRRLSTVEAQAGFIQIIIIVIGALVLLKYAYDIDVVGFLTTGKFKEWLDKLYSIATLGWEKYSTVIIKIWNYILITAKNIFNK